MLPAILIYRIAHLLCYLEHEQKHYLENLEENETTDDLKDTTAHIWLNIRAIRDHLLEDINDQLKSRNIEDIHTEWKAANLPQDIYTVRDQLETLLADQEVE